MTHASFVFRQWCGAARNRDFNNILDPESMKLHIRYPANHFLGLALSFGSPGGLVTDFQDMGLAHLRKLATLKNPDRLHQLPGQHAIHMLARFGTAADQSMIGELIESAATSDDPLSVRLGYAGLMQRPEHEYLAEKYIWMLQRDEALAFVDLLFEAVHYGDAMLDSNRTIPNTADRFEKSLSSIVRRLEQGSQSEVIRNLEVFRILGLMDRVGPVAFRDPALAFEVAIRAQQSSARI